MGKVLRILVVLLLPLCIAAVWLATLSYGKRELIIARNQVLVAGYVKLAPTIEDKPGEVTEQKVFPPKDISPPTVDFLDKAPETSDFWQKKYSAVLELQAKSMLDYNNRKIELMTLYKKDALGKDELDEMGNKKTTGEGTSQGVIDELVKKSGEQLNRLNETRQMLTIVRDELIDTITDYNKRKGELRKCYKDIDNLKAELDKVTKELEDLKPKVKAAEDAKKAAEERAADFEKQVADRDEKIKELEIDLKKEKERAKVAQQTTDGNIVPAAQFNFTPGIKGKIVAVNERWNYVLIEFDEAFLKEAMGDDLANPARPAPVGCQMSVKRTGTPELFITKIRLTQVRAKEKHGIGDVMIDWKQTAVKEGDIVFFP